MHLTTFLICLAGFAALALATERQQQTFFNAILSRSRTRRLRIAGWGALIVALAVIVTRQGWGMGLVNYSGQTSAAAGLVYLALIVGERRR
ncbi:hypothetical protein PIN31009_01769 [Pandoraea iniqua]|uniref:DUF3325 family protein n=1 Tax=Pandoraea iniqua TaxID=2508288 RepID=UPI00125717CA|nr:DUF3325 family protein [Pandoraea iniqua]VVD93875.1 hypothetical protein PIN31009_01769 [Pandoraea iniqua]